MKRLMKIVITVMAFVMLLTGLTPVADAASAKTSIKSSKRNVIYCYSLKEIYNGSDVDFRKYYTDVIIHADNFVNSDGSVNTNSSKFENLDKVDDYCRVWISLRGTSSKSGFGKAMMNADSRKNALVNLKKAFIYTDKVYGIDLDWEYYDDYSNRNTYYQEFAHALHAETKKYGKKLSLAAQKSDKFWNSKAIIKMMKDDVDYINIMTYDGSYDDKMAGKISANAGYTEMTNLANKIYKVVGSHSKINFGIPFYGYSFKSGSLKSIGSKSSGFIEKPSYKTIMSKIGSQRVHHYQQDPYGHCWVAMTQKSDVQYVFDDTTTVAAKAYWAAKQGFGGVMCWVASSDDSSRALSYAIVKTLNQF